MNNKEEKYGLWALIAIIALTWVAIYLAYKLLFG